MSARVDKLALEAYPLETRPNIFDSRYKTDINAKPRKAFIEGYEQAEKDTISLIESRLSELQGDAQPTPILRYELLDLVKKIKED